MQVPKRNKIIKHQMLKTRLINLLGLKASIRKMRKNVDTHFYKWLQKLQEMK